MLWHARMYDSNIKTIIEASSGIFIIIYANLSLVAPFLLLYLWLLRTQFKDYLANEGCIIITCICHC